MIDPFLPLRLRKRQQLMTDDPTPSLADTYESLTLDGSAMTATVLPDGNIEITAPVTADGGTEPVGDFTAVYPPDHKLADGSPAFTVIPACCHIGCDLDATVEIFTLRTAPPAATNFAGPDPNLDETFACDIHVGLLLGHQPDAVDPDQLYWEVLPLDNHLPNIPGAWDRLPDDQPIESEIAIVNAWFDADPERESYFDREAALNFVRNTRFKGATVTGSFDYSIADRDRRYAASAAVPPRPETADWVRIDALTKP